MSINPFLTQQMYWESFIKCDNKIIFFHCHKPDGNMCCKLLSSFSTTYFFDKVVKIVTINLSWPTYQTFQLINHTAAGIFPNFREAAPCHPLGQNLYNQTKAAPVNSIHCPKLDWDMCQRKLLGGGGGVKLIFSHLVIKTVIL